MKVLILGAGGHGITLLDAIYKLSSLGVNIQVCGFLDDSPEMQGELISGVPVIGPIDSTHMKDVDAVVLGIGNNQKRKFFFERLSAEKVQIASIIHPTAVIAQNSTIETGVYIGPNVIIGVESHIGQNVIINGNSVIGHHVVIKSHTHIGPSVNISSYAGVGTGAFVGTGAILLPKSHLGDGSSLMAGSILAGIIREEVTAGGSPARAISKINAA